jgi:hypothetical protein
LQLVAEHLAGPFGDVLHVHFVELPRDAAGLVGVAVERREAAAGEGTGGEQGGENA